MVAAGTGDVPSSSHIYCCRCWLVPRDPIHRFWSRGSRPLSGPSSSSSMLKEDPCKLSVLQCQQPSAEWGGLGATVQPAYGKLHCASSSSWIVCCLKVSANGVLLSLLWCYLGFFHFSFFSWTMQLPQMTTPDNTWICEAPSLFQSLLVYTHLIILTTIFCCGHCRALCKHLGADALLKGTSTVHTCPHLGLELLGPVPYSLRCHCP